MSVAELLGYVASLLVFTTFYVKTMVPLRTVAIASNIAFMAYALMDQLYPVLVLHLTLLPLNVYRLIQILQMIRQVENAATSDMDLGVLLPYMSRTKRRRGDTVFKKGDRADAIYYLATGEIYLQEIGVTVGNGEVIGEISLFSPDQARTATAVCRTDCDLYALSAAKIQELYYQNPTFGFTLLRLITARLLENIELMRATDGAR